MSEEKKRSKFPLAKNEPTHKDPELVKAYQIDFQPKFEKDRGPKEPFVNEYGVVIGDYLYVSENSPLENWSTEVDPSIMSGDQWVHPFNDVGFNTRENRDIFEKGIHPLGYPFMHPTHDMSYNNDFIPEKNEDEE